MSSLDFNEGGGEAPFGVQLSPGQSVRPEAVRCDFDGSGAGGAFYLVLHIVSPSGVKVSTTRSPDALASGDTGVATFAPFLGRDPEVVPPVVGAGPTFYVANDDAGVEWSDIWMVPAGGGMAVQVTANPPDTHDGASKLSPDETRIAFQRSDLVDDRHLWVCDVDGSNQTELSTLTAEWIFWLDADTIVFQSGQFDVYTINADGTGLSNILNLADIRGINPAPDGSKIALIQDVGAVNQLWICNPDGSGLTLLATPVASLGGTLFPTWRLDGSAIVFPTDSGLDQINPDGSGQTTLIGSPLLGFWFGTSMWTDRMFYSDLSNFAQWRLGQAVFGVGASLVSPTLFMLSQTQSAVQRVAQGRIFTVQRGALMGGANSLVSILPDGSDRTEHFVPDQSGAPLFQQVFIESP